jgi:hypothetical protein
MDSKAIILELISEVEHQMDLRNIKNFSALDWKLERLPLDYCTAKYELAQWRAEDGDIYHILIDDCYYDGHSLQIELITQEESSREVTDSYYVCPAKLIERDDENAYFWHVRVPLVIERILRYVLNYFHREDIANAGLTIERSWTLEELEVRFNVAFEADLWIYEGMKRIRHDPRRIEEFGTVTSDTLCVRGIDQVGDIVRRMHDSFGLTVRIRDCRFARRPPDNTPLYNVRETKRPYHPDIKKK